MAESAVVFLINKLGCLAEYQFQLVKGVWDEILCLRVELERIRAWNRTRTELRLFRGLIYPRRYDTSKL